MFQMAVSMEEGECNQSSTITRTAKCRITVLTLTKNRKSRCLKSRTGAMRVQATKRIQVFMKPKMKRKQTREEIQRIKNKFKTTILFNWIKRSQKSYETAQNKKIR
jgi:hypothetical protein